ncbi:MAG TPA: hypothetical protein VEV43_04590 [Actinomycetota bacterium]|nr:hypothetical protein [Actinomycetota bacterium]
MWASRSPRRPRPSPESTELGPETPGLANLVAHRSNPTRDAVPATLVDLAARGLIEIEDRGIGRYYCRLTGKAAELTPYERMLVDHLRSLAADGVIPAEALTTGPQDRSKAWWDEFRKKLVAHAQSAGLCTNLWNATAISLLVGGGVVLLVLYALATGFNDPDDVADSPLLNAVTLGALPAIFALGAVVKSTRQTSTAEGLRCGSRWLGVRRALEESPSFEQLPPSGVVVWERHLAYAAALGVAPRSVRALPMGAESDTEVWARAGTEWRKVEVRYPRFRPGWGRHPLHALGVGFLGTLFARWLLRLATGDLGGDDTWLKAIALVLFGIAVLVLTRSLPQLVLGFLDLLASRPVEGTILRARTRWSPFPYSFQGSDQQYLRYFVAIDDGRSPKLTAYRVKPSLYGALSQGTEAKLKVTPNLGYVRRLSA